MKQWLLITSKAVPYHVKLSSRFAVEAPNYSGIDSAEHDFE